MAASIFTTKTASAVGQTRTKVGAYDVPTSRAAIFIGMSVTNILTVATTVTVEYYTGSVYVAVAKNVPLKPGQSLIPFEGLGKLVAVAGASIAVTAGAASALDAVLTLLEQDA
jgi:hypothetical protein